MTKKPKRPRDTNKLAKLIVDLSTGEATEQLQPREPPRGRPGGLKGGVIRAQNLSPQKRVQIAKKAAKARWIKTRQKVVAEED